MGVEVALIKEKNMKEWWNKIMHKKFDIRWAFGVLFMGMIICIVLLTRIL